MGLVGASIEQCRFPRRAVLQRFHRLAGRAAIPTAIGPSVPARTNLRLRTRCWLSTYGIPAHQPTSTLWSSWPCCLLAFCAAASQPPQALGKHSIIVKFSVGCPKSVCSFIADGLCQLHHSLFLPLHVHVHRCAGRVQCGGKGCISVEDLGLLN